MNAFQIILLCVLAVAGLFTVVAGLRRSIGRPTAIILLLILLVGSLATIDPDRTTTVARALGVNRGTDLILYLMTLIVLQGFVIFYLRLRKVRRELTLLVRRLAILEATGAGGEPGLERDRTADRPVGPIQS